MPDTLPILTTEQLYGGACDISQQNQRQQAALQALKRTFGSSKGARFFSAPGRSELGGNHTDHQHGHVLAATVSLDMIAAVTPRSDDLVRIVSNGFRPFALSIKPHDLRAHMKERRTSAAFIRGVAAYLHQQGFRIGGFNASILSDVPRGSGLSSSAAFSVLIATIFSGLYNSGSIPPVVQAKAGKYAENHYFGKPSGLMDQLACAEGGYVAIDFSDEASPKVTRIACDLTKLGYGFCIVNAGGSHAKLTDQYAAIPADMRAVAALFGKTVLGDVDADAFWQTLPTLRGKVTDLALLRAMHFFEEDARVSKLADALMAQDIERFRRLMLESGRSSFMQLQNVCPLDAHDRSLALALAATEKALGQRGAWRVHGGGFAGTILTLLPNADMQAYTETMERLFGSGCCYRLSVRTVGGAEIHCIGKQG